MKILFKNRSFGGGAPKSLLSYMKIAKDKGYEVFSVGAFNYDPTEYKEKNIKTLNLPYFELHRPLYNFKIMMNYLKIIQKEKPDIIHATTLYNLYFQHVVEKLTHIPSVYMIPGGQISSFSGKVFSNILKDKNIVVYSQENREELLQYKVKDENILVIPNRIDFKEIELSDKSFDVYRNRTLKDTIHSLMITRFSETKINSIRHTIKLTVQLAQEGIPIELTILGSGYYLDEIKEEASEINKQFNRDIIKLPGYQNQVHEYVKKAHIIYGKGRSVIDGIMQKKISAVVNENDQVFVCTSDNFKKLSDYNLTGRNELPDTSYEELKTVCLSINQNKIKKNDLEELYEVTQQNYDINVVKDKVISIYENVKKDEGVNYSPSYLKILKEYLLFYVLLVLQFLKRD